MAPRDKAAVAKNTLVDSVLKLEAHYGAPGPPPTTDPFEMIVWENAAYLVDDTRRRTVFELLRRKVGMEPEAIAAAPLEKLAAVIETGGMRPAMRAGKLRTAAALALEIGLARLREAVRSSPAEARKLLKRFPGIGDPGADKILLFARARRSLAPDSNILRVLVRLGFGREEANYARTYASAARAVEALLLEDVDWCVRAHLLLRRHGRELCKRASPRCEICPLTKACRWYRARAG